MAAIVIETPLEPREWTPTPAVLPAHGGGVTWTAVLGGAVVIASLNLMLLALGAGIGLSAISPWSGAGATSTQLGTGVIAWYILMQVAAGAFGGYLTGRFRRKWIGIHQHEVHFRDTAHGFLAWGAAFIATVGFLATAGTFLAGSAVGNPATPAIAVGDQTAGPNAYWVDMLLRGATATTDSGGVARVSPDVSPAARAEAARIFDRAVAQNGYQGTDRGYLATLIASRTGLSQADADKRAADVLTQAQAAADAVRRATAHSLYWIFAALLIGAFCASFMATIGGRHRDDVVVLT